MGERSYRPSNGDEGIAFMGAWCDRCRRDAAFQRGEGDSCPIAAASMAFREDDPRYPPEWIEDDVRYPAPGNPRCTAFEAVEGGGMIRDARQMKLANAPTCEAVDER